MRLERGHLTNTAGGYVSGVPAWRARRCARRKPKSLVWRKRPGATHLNHLCFFSWPSGRQQRRFLAAGKCGNVCFNGRNAEDRQEALAASSFSGQVWRWESRLNATSDAAPLRTRGEPQTSTAVTREVFECSRVDVRWWLVFSASGWWEGAVFLTEDVTVSPAASQLSWIILTSSAAEQTPMRWK